MTSPKNRLRSITEALDWRLVRGLGQLHVLSRVSLFMLFFVPLLAAAWPAIPLTLAFYNDTLADIQNALGRAVDALESTLPVDSTPGTRSHSDSAAPQRAPSHRLTTRLQRQIASLDRIRMRSEAHLPRSWALAFFGSLAVLLGRTVFQLACPETVKDFRLDQFVQAKKREYSEAPSSTAVIEATELLKGLPEARELLADEENAETAGEREEGELARRLAEAEGEMRRLKAARNVAAEATTRSTSTGNRLSETIEEVRALRDELRRARDRDRGDKGPDFRRRMALVEMGAVIFYRAEATKTRLPMLVSGACYALAIGVALVIILAQSMRVAAVAGWLP